MNVLVLKDEKLLLYSRRTVIEQYLRDCFAGRFGSFADSVRQI